MLRYLRSAFGGATGRKRAVLTPLSGFTFHPLLGRYIIVYEQIEKLHTFSSTVPSPDPRDPMTSARTTIVIWGVSFSPGALRPLSVLFSQTCRSFHLCCVAMIASPVLTVAGHLLPRS